MMQKILSGWGNYPKIKAHVKRPEQLQELGSLTGSLTPRGLGRSYGDASLNGTGSVVMMERLNRFLDFDNTKGILTLEAGVSLAEILKYFVPKGWFLPVTPGTKWATLGGCIACDVHGKNQHTSGTFGHFIKEISLHIPGKDLVFCSPEINRDLFYATIGGMGLTGIIVEAKLQLIPIQNPWIVANYIRANNLSHLLSLLDDPEKSGHYSVAWIDCFAKGSQFGRGIALSGHHPSHEELINHRIPKTKIFKDRRVPLSQASPFLRPSTVKLFNKLYYSSYKWARTPTLVHYEPFFYPLDGLRQWNRLYGKRGFVQYQCVFPKNMAEEGLKRLLKTLAAQNKFSYLAVLKRFEGEGCGLLSFPMSGFTLALDIPLTQDLPRVLNYLDEIVLNYNGRVYLAKDAHLTPTAFRNMYRNFVDWKSIKEMIDPDWIFSSDLSRRLQMEAPI